jgi:hypothetical protein
MNSLDTPCGLAAKWAAIVTLSLLMLWFGRLAREPVKDGPIPIVRLELAPTVRSADQFMSAWKAARQSWQQDLDLAQSWDTWFICAYAPLFALLCWVAAQRFSIDFPRLAAFGFALAGLQLLAGALDFLENASMQKTIDSGFATAPWPTIGATASAIKWLLIAAFLLYGTGAALHWLVGSLRK